MNKTKQTNSAPDPFSPPNGYGIVESGIFRCSQHIDKSNFLFLEQLNIRTAIYISVDPLPKEASSYITARNIVLVNPYGRCSTEVLTCSLTDLGEEIIKEGLEILLNTNRHPVLLFESSENHESVLVGCLRRIQMWSLTSIFDEYRTFTNQNSLFDENEQLIERFDPSLVNFPENLPEWMCHHIHMLEQEQQYQARRSVQEKNTHLNPTNQEQPDLEQHFTSATMSEESVTQSPVNLTLQNVHVKETQMGFSTVNEIPFYGLPGICYWGPLVSSASKFSEKRSILDEDYDG